MILFLIQELREVQGAKNSPSQTARPGERLVDYYLRHISSQDAIRAEWFVFRFFFLFFDIFLLDDMIFLIVY